MLVVAIKGSFINASQRLRLNDKMTILSKSAFVTLATLRLQFVCHINRISMIVEYAKGPLLAGLDDKSSYVRRTAVIGCLKLFKLAPDVFEGITSQVFNHELRLLL